MSAPESRSSGVRRSRSDAVLGGVCAGIARATGLDPLLLRIAVVAVTVLTGGGALLAYLAAWILIPREPAAPGARAPGGVSLPRGANQPGPPLDRAVDAGAGTTAPRELRAAWTAAGNDIRSLAGELRRKPPGGAPAAGASPAGGAVPPGRAVSPGSPTWTSSAAPTGTGNPSAGADTTGAPPPPGADAPSRPAPLPEATTDPTAADPATEPPPEAGPAPRSPLAAADDIATALGDRLRAPEFQDGARRAANSVSHAVSASVDEVGKRIRRDRSEPPAAGS